MEDWRLTNQIDYLFRQKLKRECFSNFPNEEHEHCEFCWVKFGHENDNVKFGYCTKDAYYWICDTCFKDFKDIFEWEVEN